jgi:hypothetical protein
MSCIPDQLISLSITFTSGQNIAGVFIRVIIFQKKIKFFFGMRLILTVSGHYTCISQLNFYNTNLK